MDHLKRFLEKTVADAFGGAVERACDAEAMVECHLVKLKQQNALGEAANAVECEKQR